MKEIFGKLREYTNKEDAVLVTIIASSGSTPRGAGARMVVSKKGLINGTIGGGAVEYKALQIAAKALKSKQSCIEEFSLTRDEVAGIGMICGGEVTVYFQYIPAFDAAIISLLDIAISLFDQPENAWLVFDISNKFTCKMGIYSKSTGIMGIDFEAERLAPLLDRKTAIKKIDDRVIYIEPLTQAGMVYIFGGGHIAQELVPLLVRVDFRCTVVDDRKEFSNRTLFPDAQQIITRDFEDILQYVTICKNDYVVIMTRGHKCDFIIQTQALKTDACYIGVIGSREKIAKTNEKLIERGFCDSDISRIHTPIGLDIKADTPAEIAISIAAELIKIRADQKTI